jgi:PilZ domain
MESLPERFHRDQRLAKRHSVKTALRVRIWKSSTPEERAESVNLSQRGIFFVTNSRFQEGETVEILLKMPEEITGGPPTEWRCTGLVTRVEAVDSARGKFGVGVRFDCYEVARGKSGEVPVVTPALGL